MRMCTCVYFFRLFSLQTIYQHFYDRLTLVVLWLVRLLIQTPLDYSVTSTLYQSSGVIFTRI